MLRTVGITKARSGLDNTSCRYLVIWENLITIILFYAVQPLRFNSRFFTHSKYLSFFFSKPFSVHGSHFLQVSCFNKVLSGELCRHGWDSIDWYLGNLMKETYLASPWSHFELFHYPLRGKCHPLTLFPKWLAFAYIPNKEMLPLKQFSSKCSLLTTYV